MMTQNESSSALAKILQNPQAFQNDLKRIGNNIIRRLRQPGLELRERSDLVSLLMQLDQALAYLASPEINEEQALAMVSLLTKMKQAKGSATPFPVQELYLCYEAILQGVLLETPSRRKLVKDVGAERSSYVDDSEKTAKTMLKVLEKKEDITEKQAEGFKMGLKALTLSAQTKRFIDIRKEMAVKEMLDLPVTPSLREDNPPSSDLSVMEDEKAVPLCADLPTIPNPLQFLPPADEKAESLVDDHFNCLISNLILYRPVTTGIDNDRFYEESFLRNWVLQGHSASPFMPNQQIKQVAFNKPLADTIRQLIKSKPSLVADQHCPVEEMIMFIAYDRADLVESLLHYDVHFRLLAEAEITQEVKKSSNKKIHGLFREHLEAYKVRQYDLMLKGIAEEEYELIEKLLKLDQLNRNTFLTDPFISEAVMQADERIKKLFQMARKELDGTEVKIAAISTSDSRSEGTAYRESNYEMKNDLLQQTAEKQRIKMGPIKFSDRDLLEQMIHFGAPVLGKIGSAYSEEECFYDSVAQGLENAMIPIPVTAEEPGYKKLRKLCHQFALENPDFSQEKLNIKVEEYEQYVSAILLSAIKGSLDREGILICKMLNIQLHVIELSVMNSRVIVDESKHHLIDAYSARTINITDFYDSIYADPCIIHLLYDKNKAHFMPMLPHLERLRCKKESAPLEAPALPPALSLFPVLSQKSGASDDGLSSSVSTMPTKKQEGIGVLSSCPLNHSVRLFSMASQESGASCESVSPAMRPKTKQ